jgi:hypothetical protein
MLGRAPSFPATTDQAAYNLIIRHFHRQIWPERDARRPPAGHESEPVHRTYPVAGPVGL